MDKHRHDLVISDEVYRGLKVFITNKQEGQFKKGDISKWVNIAISNLTQGINTHARNTQNKNPYHIPAGRLKVKNMMEDICNEFLRSGIRATPLSQGNTILLKHLEKIIQDVTGHHDPRAIKNHMKDLIRYEYIKDQGYVGSFLILNTGTDLEEIDRVMEQQKQDEKKQQKQNHQKVSKSETFDEETKTELKKSEATKKEFDDMIKGYTN
jgi:hypothetical protein